MGAAEAARSAGAVSVLRACHAASGSRLPLAWIGSIGSYAMVLLVAR
jgi:hypothetical protein